MTKNHQVDNKFFNPLCFAFLNKEFIPQTPFFLSNDFENEESLPLYKTGDNYSYIENIQLIFYDQRKSGYEPSMIRRWSFYDIIMIQQ